ncbi:transposase [Methanocalculus alkaliphilus]|nr:transposase [Methanocalculus alkaliphilus]
MFESTKMQKKLRTNEFEPNDNISFPIGTMYLVNRLYEVLNFCDIFGKHKTRGIDINNLLRALISYKLTDNFSIKRSHDWINRPEVRAEFTLPSFSERTLYRVLEILGAKREEIISDIQDVLFERYEFEHTNINMDWSSLVLYGQKAPLGKYGYSRDHRPDKKQITIGVTELADPINVPIGMTIEPGNLNDQIHFKKTYRQSSGRLREGSLVIFDKGANSIANTQMIPADNMQYNHRKETQQER